MEGVVEGGMAWCWQEFVVSVVIVSWLRMPVVRMDLLCMALALLLPVFRMVWLCLGTAPGPVPRHCRLKRITTNARNDCAGDI